MDSLPHRHTHGLRVGGQTCFWFGGTRTAGGAQCRALATPAPSVGSLHPAAKAELGFYSLSKASHLGFFIAH